MERYASSRRAFLQHTAALAGTSWARLSLPAIATLSQAACTAREDKTPFTILNEAEAREFEAIAARILPTTSTPGAREAGVIYFLDQSFGTNNVGSLDFARGGLEQFQSGIDGDHPFSELSEDAQDAYIATQDRTPFFGFMSTMTLFGFFGMSKYGGNKDDIGWKLVGMDPGAHAYQSPFGYYDAEYLKEHPNG